MNMRHARKHAAFSVFCCISLVTSFMLLRSRGGMFDPSDIIADSVIYDTVKNASSAPESLLKSLSHYVDGEWLFRGESGANFNSSAFPSLKVVYGQQGRKKKLVHFQAATQTNGRMDDLPSEPLRFVPTFLLPITCPDQDVHCKNEHTSHESESIPINMEVQHLTPQQVAQCLRNQRILMIGDSHMRNLWRALMDVLVGNFQHDYHRWDGYQDWQDFPMHISWDHVDQFLPNTMYARMNDHSKIGVQGACSFIPKNERNSNVTGVGHYWNCLSARESNAVRRDFDIRRLESKVTTVNNITIDASWCASSFRVGLDDNAEVKGEECRDTKQFFTREKGDNTSHLERLLSETTYDTVIVGYHVHDVKREHCSKAGTDPIECRKDLGKDLISNTERFASWAEGKKINLVWVTTGPMLLDRIPEQYRSNQLPEDMNYEMETMARIMKSKGFPVLDAYHIGATCDRTERAVRANGGEWPPCFSDGMHASRFLDRAKAQILLNWRCN